MPIIKGATIRETLFGRIRLGQYVSSNCDDSAATPQLPLAIIIKEFNTWQTQQQVTKDGQSIYEDAGTELSVHALLQHNNIIALYDIIYTPERTYAILEYASHGELFTLIKNQQFDHSQSQRYFAQLCSAVHYCHTQHYTAHRDISLENILMSGSNQLKLCDFGLAWKGNENNSDADNMIHDTRRVGKLKYMAPEVFASESYNPYKADCWSLGVVLFILLTSVFPWDLPSVTDGRCVQACRGKSAIHAMIQHWKLQALDDAAVDLMAQLFCAPDDRINSSQIMEHPYVQQMINNKQLQQCNFATDAVASTAPVAVTESPVVVVTVCDPVMFSTPVKAPRQQHQKPDYDQSDFQHNAYISSDNCDDNNKSSCSNSHSGHRHKNSFSNNNSSYNKESFYGSPAVSRCVSMLPPVSNIGRSNSNYNNSYRNNDNTHYYIHSFNSNHSNSSNDIHSELTPISSLSCSALTSPSVSFDRHSYQQQQFSQQQQQQLMHWQYQHEAQQFLNNNHSSNKNSNNNSSVVAAQ